MPIRSPAARASSGVKPEREVMLLMIKVLAVSRAGPAPRAAAGNGFGPMVVWAGEIRRSGGTGRFNDGTPMHPGALTGESALDNPPGDMALLGHLAPLPGGGTDGVVADPQVPVRAERHDAQAWRCEAERPYPRGWRRGEDTADPVPAPPGRGARGKDVHPQRVVGAVGEQADFTAGQLYGRGRHVRLAADAMPHLVEFPDRVVGAEGEDDRAAGRAGSGGLLQRGGS
jgi:hypothetical protein